jgi:hypothetical protein
VRASPHHGAWVPRLLLVIGWFYAVIGAISLAGHVMHPADAGTPELGTYGGWILDGLSLATAAAVLWFRWWLIRRWRA